MLLCKSELWRWLTSADMATASEDGRKSSQGLARLANQTVMVGRMESVLKLCEPTDTAEATPTS